MNLLHNDTPWRAEALPFVDDQGREGRLVVVKIQYTLDDAGGVRINDMTDPLVHEDRFDGAGADAPLLQPADVMAPQSATNVMLIGHAYAPTAVGARHFEPWLGVDRRIFPMRVHGPRFWRRRAWLTRALTLFIVKPAKRVRAGRVTRLPLLWRHAYGGVDGHDAAESWPHNPAGSGYHHTAKAALVDRLRLPALEDPRQPIRHWRDRRVPHLPGAVSPMWAPRIGLAGTRDARWRALRSPAMPEDGSPSFHNTAHPALQFTPHLSGGEPIRAEGFRAGGLPIAFDLPMHRIVAHAYHFASITSHPLPMNGLLLEPDANRLSLIYRCFVPHLRDGFDLRHISVVIDTARTELPAGAGT